MIKYNSNSSYTHERNLINYNLDMKKDIRKNTFINRLEKLEPNIIKEINQGFIIFYYKTFKVNKNNLYANAYISCVYDIDNKLPIYYDIFKSSNEIINFADMSYF